MRTIPQVSRYYVLTGAARKRVHRMLAAQALAIVANHHFGDEVGAKVVRVDHSSGCVYGVEFPTNERYWRRVPDEIAKVWKFRMTYGDTMEPRRDRAAGRAMQKQIDALPKQPVENVLARLGAFGISRADRPICPWEVRGALYVVPGIEQAPPVYVLEVEAPADVAVTERPGWQQIMGTRAAVLLETPGTKRYRGRSTFFPARGAKLDEDC